ncbi:MAG: hypothetical protein Q9N34_09755 [Aquificota bacterium]|nr:hypothetical protein [Aquificota bacterium]
MKRCTYTPKRPTDSLIKLTTGEIHSTMSAGMQMNRGEFSSLAVFSISRATSGVLILKAGTAKPWSLAFSSRRDP